MPGQPTERTLEKGIPVNRGAVLLMLGVLATSLGMTGQGCYTVPILRFIAPPAPAIIPTNDTDDSRQWSFTVDLRDYPETRRITWDFGDGAVATDLPISVGQTVTHEFARGGTFVVTVHLFTPPDLLNEVDGGLLVSGRLPIDVIAPNVPPIAAFRVEDVLDENGTPKPLTKRFLGAASSDPDGSIVSFLWDFGDGVHDEGETVEHTFVLSARFTVRLIVVDDRGDRGTTTRIVLGNTQPVADFIVTEDPTDAMTFDFDASSSSDTEGPITSYRWDFGDDSPQETGRIVSHTFAAPDDYTVTLTVADEVGGVASTSRLVDVTGTEPFLRSIAPDVGVADTTLSDVIIDGENFEHGAVLQLHLDNMTIDGTALEIEGRDTIRATLDLTGAEPGDYDVVVTNPDSSTAELPLGFRVITPNLVRLTTSEGEILLELVDDAPITTDNFLQYVEDKFYDGTIFHRVVPDFVVQGGGFLPGMVEPDGLRDPIINEFSPDRSNIRGTIAMAKLGGDPDSATSQFFFNLADNSENLDDQNGGFTVFGTVIEGMNVVDAIAEVPLDGETPIDDVLLIRAERE